MTLFGDPGEVELRACGLNAGNGGDEVVLRLHHIGRLEGEQQLAGFDGVSWLCRDASDTTGIRRKDRRRVVLVDRDLAVSDEFKTERVLFHRLDREALPLTIARIEGAGVRPGFGGFRCARLGAVTWSRIERGRDQQHQEGDEDARPAAARPFVLLMAHAGG